MSILSHFNNNAYLNSLTSLFEETVQRCSEPQLQPHTLYHYVDLIESTSKITHELGRSLLIDALHKMDETYRDSKIRKQDYYIKVVRERTLITVFGQIRFKRTVYEDKRTGKCYIYLDRKLGLPKYDRYNPTVKAMIVELYANQNSMIEVGEIIGSRIFSPFTTSQARHEHRISRQTIHNIVSRIPCVKQGFKRREITPKTLYIMADEKYVPIQTGRPEKHSKMVKHAVIYEGVHFKNKRGSLLNKTNIAHTGPNFWTQVYDVVSNIYDIDTIKQIFILGDGAHWIKAGVQEFGFNKATFALDKFHFKQAIRHIDKDESIQSILVSHVLYGIPKDFKLILESIKLKDSNLHRHKMIDDKSKYILNHWTPIRKAYQDLKYGCSMESAISHNLASIYTNRPKAYKPCHLERYLHTRVQYLNGIDIQNHYLKTQHLDSDHTHESLDTKTFDYSMFDPKPSSEHTISHWFREFTPF